MNQRNALAFFLLAAVSFTWDVKPILDSHCVECHSAGADLDLSHFPFESLTTSDQTAIVDRMLAKLSANQMPPGNRPKLGANEVSTIQTWRDQGLAP